MSRRLLINTLALMVFLILTINFPNLWRLRHLSSFLLGFGWGMVLSLAKRDWRGSLPPALLTGTISFFLYGIFDVIMIFGVAIVATIINYPDQFRIQRRGFSLRSVLISCFIRIFRAAFSVLIGIAYLYLVFHLPFTNKPEMTDHGDPVRTYYFYAVMCVFMIIAANVYDCLIRLIARRFLQVATS